MSDDELAAALREAVAVRQGDVLVVRVPVDSTMSAIAEYQQRLNAAIDDAGLADAIRWLVVLQDPQDDLRKIREVRDIQGQTGTWNDSPYMHGLYHGLELALAILEDCREPEYRDKPEDGYLCDRPTPDMSGPEYEPVAGS